MNNVSLSHKQQLRQIILSRRSQLSDAYQEECSEVICEKIMQLPCFHKARSIALYFPHRGEINLKSIWIKALSQNKTCYYPKLSSQQQLIFVQAHSKTPLTRNQYGILEPRLVHTHLIHPQQLDLVLVPLVAFDSDCYRLGMGKGYYDSTLSGLSGPSLIGVSYEFQHQAKVPRDPWDVPLDGVVTEQNIYWRTQ